MKTHFLFGLILLAPVAAHAQVAPSPSFASVLNGAAQSGTTGFRLGQAPSFAPLLNGAAQSGSADFRLSQTPSFASVLNGAAQSGTADFRLSQILPGRRGSSLDRFASGTGNVIYLAAGTLLPLIEDGKDGKQHSLRTLDALIVSTLITEGLKVTVRERRPDSTERNSFPSGHATAAFAVATMQAHFHPKQAILWYAGAAGIAISRVDLRRHYTNDILAGAAVGFLSARAELMQGRGLLLRPFIRSESPREHVTGLSVGGTF